MRSSVRSRLAPPVFARYAGYDLAGRRALFESVASEDCHGVVREANEAGLAKSVPAASSNDRNTSFGTRNPRVPQIVDIVKAGLAGSHNRLIQYDTQD
jgi:hypothetical protein